MIDPVLERRLVDCRSLLKLWTLFQMYFEAAIKGDGINHDNEKKFLDLKSRIAMLHDTFVETVEDGAQSAVAQGMLDNVIRSITLKHINRLPSADIKKMQIEWHESYLLLNEVIGQLEEKQTAVAKISHSQWQAQQARKAFSRFTANMWNSNMLRGGLIIGGVLAVLVVLPMMGVFSYGALRDIGPIQKPVYAVMESVIRPYIVKVNWRNIFEAKQFGAKSSGDPTQAFPDYAPNPKANLPRGADQFPQWVSAVASAGGAPIADLSGVQPMTLAKEASFEAYLVAGSSNVSIFYFLMNSAQEAEQAANGFRSWTAGLPPAVKDAVSRFQVDNDYNLLIMILAQNEANGRAILEQIWETQKVKKG